MKISVIMPVYNRELYLPKAIESVLSQTCRNFELLIVDDGSNDRSPETIKAYAQKDKRISFVFHPKNRGVSAAGNTALEMAQGEWITVIDSDDAYHPQRLEKLLQLAEREEGIFVADDYYLCFDRGGELVPWGRGLPSNKILFPQNTSPVIDLSIYLINIGAALKPFFPSWVITDYNLRFTEGCQFAEDLEFLCHLFRVGLKLKILYEPLYFMRLTPGSLTAKENMLRNFTHILGVYERLIMHSGFSHEEKKLFTVIKSQLYNERDYLAFTMHLERLDLKEAFHLVFQNPNLLFKFVKNIPRSLQYRITARIQKGRIKS